MRRLARSTWLLAGLLGACAGSVPVPMVQVPLMQRQGEVEAGLAVGPASRRPEIGGTVRVAATDTLRLGASVSGSGRPPYEERGGSRLDVRDQAPKLFSDAFVGAEWGGLLFRAGALVGAGYGLRDWGDRCQTPTTTLGCAMQEPRRGDTQFVRSYGQLHFGLAPPGPLAVSLAVRVPVVVELPSSAQPRDSEVGTEVALTQTLRFRHLRLDLQPLWSRTRGFAFHLGLLFRVTP